jgi:hypothetical protein
VSEQLLAEQAWVRILRHLESRVIESEAELTRDIKTIIRQAEVATKSTLDISVSRIIEGIALIAGPS